jgi:cytochrome c oxidase subunit II
MTRAATRAVVGLVGALSAVAATGCGARIDSFYPVTAQGSAINNLFWLELFISAGLMALVVAVLVLAIARFRARPGEPDPAQHAGNRTLEVVWTAVPVLVLAVIFVLMVQTMTFANAAEPNAPTVRVIGHQFWWEFQYPANPSFATANELHLPLNTTVVLELTGADVIHSFWVPQFGLMRDAIPGKVNQLPIRVTEQGSYIGGCNQYCGLQHAWMREVVVAEPPDQFQAWATRQAQPAAATGTRGEQVFLQNTCVNCHAIRGTSANAQVGPDLTHVGSRSILGAGVVENNPENMRRWISDPQSIKPGVLMPAYPNLSEGDLAALADYLESLK